MSLKEVLTPEATAENEDIAVVPTAVLLEHFVELPERGILPVREEEVVELLGNHWQFLPRNNELETNSDYKQIIPYFVLRNEKGEIFFSRRKLSGGDSRLHGKGLVGFGGHLRKGDIVGAIYDWLRREMEEELKVEEVKKIEFRGLIHDGTDNVGGVHLGLLVVMEIGGEVEVLEKEKMEEGEFVGLGDLMNQTEGMETWSQLVVEFLRG